MDCAAIEPAHFPSTICGRCARKKTVHGYALTRPDGCAPRAPGEAEERDIRTKQALFLGVAALAIAALLGAPVVQLGAQQAPQNAPAGVTVGEAELGGMVVS